MAQSKHTPGPWEASAFKSGSLNMATGDASEMRHAGYDIRASEPKMFGGTPLLRADISAADARLIAAAPDLLEALCLAESFMAGFEDNELQDGINDRLAIVRAAIAKAEGRS